MLKRARATIATSAVIGMTLAALALPAPASSVELPALPEISLDRLLTIAGLPDVPAGIGVEIHADFPAESPLVVDGVEYTSLTALVTPAGGVETQSATPARIAGGREADAECSDNFFTPTGRRWEANDLPVVWRFRRGTTPDGVGKWRTQRALREAHAAWVGTRSSCTDGDAIDFEYRFGGLTSKRLTYNKVNTVEFGKLGEGALAVNYSWYSGTRILEVDLRFNRTEYPWTARDGGKRKFQVENVAVHELGHQIGLDDLSDPHGSLTMFGRINRGEMAKATLGAGDVRGARLLTP